jgi:uncharacterized membrane protein
MLWLVAAVQWLHVTCGVLWVGGAAILEIVVGPAFSTLPPAHRRSLGRLMGDRLGAFFAIMSVGA